MTAGAAGVVMALSLIAGGVLFKKFRKTHRRGLLAASIVLFIAAFAAAVYLLAAILLLGEIA